MAAPTLHFDERYGDAKSPPAWTEIEVALERAELFWISTVRDNEQPHVTPLIALWLDGALYFCTGPREQKARNLSGNPRCTFTTGCNTWADGLDVVVEGIALRVTAAGELQRIADAFEQKYGSDWHFDVGDGGFVSQGVDIAHVFRVPPAHVYAFGKAPHSQTRFTFD